MNNPLRIASRVSLLAEIQARIVRDFIIKFHKNLLKEDFITIPIRTSGDWHTSQQEQTFLDLGGTKGLFVKEIEESLLSGAADLAVHSMKDVPLEPADGLTFVAILPRADPRDVLITSNGTAMTLDDLPAGSLVGTSSLRRKAQVLAKRPDLCVTPFRGNVDTRLQKLRAGAVQATLLALAGLTRLGKFDETGMTILDPAVMLPAPGQGALGIQVRRDNEKLQALCAAITDPVAASCVEAERAALKVLDGSCRAPVAALAVIKDGRLSLEALAAKPNGTLLVQAVLEGLASDAVRIGEDLGREIKGRLPRGFFSA